MAKLIALEWDGREARVAVARSRPGSIVVEHAFALDLGPSDPGQTFADVSVGERVARELATRGVRYTDALVAVGRASIELRVLNVPPAPSDELPDMVRFQAMRQFSALGDDWPLDFVVLEQTEEETNVLAAAISPEMVLQLQQTCEAGNLKPRSLVLRPFAAASLLQRSSLSSGCRLMVDILADEADLTVVLDGKVGFMRTVRRAHIDDPEKSNRSLIGEIRRTMVAAQNQLGGRVVEGVIVCGDAEDHGTLKDQIEEQLSLPTKLLDPFESVTFDSQLRRPVHPGRFAPLLGMLLNEVRGSEHSINFLNPRRRKEASSGTGRNLLYAGLAAGVLAVLAGGVWMFWADQQSQLRAYNEEYQSLLKREPVSQKDIKEAEKVDLWVEGDINWLDELRDLSEKYPDADEAIVTNFVATSRDTGGRMTLSCQTANTSVIAEAVDGIRDARHQVISKNRGLTKDQSRYSTKVTLQVNVSPASEAETEPTPPTDGPADKPAGDQGAAEKRGSQS